jgi:type IV pilus assembly protein PilY1
MQTSNTPQTWTVLAETLASAGQYFATGEENGSRIGKGPANFGFYQRPYRYQHTSCNSTQGCDATTTDDYGTPINTLSPILYPCQKSFVIFITDGLPNYDNDWNVVTSIIGNYDGDSETQDCPHGTSGCPTDGRANYLDDVAKYLFDKDLRSDLPGKQNLVTYIVGFTIDDPLLSSAASQGGGKYYTANDATQLHNALQNAIQDILDGVSSGTAVAAISTSAEADDLLIRSTFLPGKWQGSLEAFRLPYTEDAEPLWEAGQVLSTTLPAARNIFTYLASEADKQDFRANNATLVNSLATLWSVDAMEAAKRIDYVRGVDAAPYRDREGWLLGDIIHSTPVYIGPPVFFYQEHNYQEFKQQKANRQEVIYVGANDGMLHAFDASDGHEVWGFIPEGTQARLPALITDACHEYFVDLTPKAADVWDGSAWKTVLCGGNRLADGEDNWCLDITNPAAHTVSVLWDTVLFPGRKTSIQPLIAKVQPTNTWVAIFTSGYDEGTNVGKIAAVNVNTGTKQAIWHDGSAVVTELDLSPKTAANPYYSLSSPNGIDTDNDGYIDLIYAGDTEGRLWKFYYDYTMNIWKKAQLFQTSSGQPITTRPIVSFGKNQELIIYFGTGKYFVGVDKTDTTQNTFYALVEKKVTTDNDNDGHYTSALTIDKNDLVDMTGIKTESQFAALAAETRDDVLNQGWYVNLDSPGGNPSERVIGDAVVVAGTLFFTSFTPNEDVCGFGGSSRLYAIDYRTGVRNGSITYATHDERYQELGSGVPSQPVFFFDKQDRKKKLFMQTSDTTLHEKQPNLPEDTVSILYWRTIHH